MAKKAIVRDVMRITMKERSHFRGPLDGNSYRRICLIATCDIMICDGRLPRWVTTLMGDNKGNMKIAWDKRITVILSGLSYLHWLSRLSNSEINVFLLENVIERFFLEICIKSVLRN